MKARKMTKTRARRTRHVARLRTASLSDQSLGCRIMRKHIEYGPVTQAYGESNCRWVEHVSAGLRLVGYADELAGLRHTRWFLDEDFQDETARGVVYRLPAKRGEARYVYGYADPFNADAAFLSFDVTSDKRDAAVWADRMAERMAEDEREYRAASSAGMHYRELEDEIKAYRADAKALVRDMKRARLLGLCDLPAITKAAREGLRRLRELSHKAYEKREELKSSYGYHAAFEE